MSFTPNQYGCVKVLANTVAQDVSDPNPSTGFEAVLVTNCGPSIAFVDRTFTSAPNPAIVDRSMPILPGATVGLIYVSTVSLVSENTSTVYVTFGHIADDGLKSH
jgi:hypothetical protein